jgi:hypothetical protein
LPLSTDPRKSSSVADEEGGRRGGDENGRRQQRERRIALSDFRNKLESRRSATTIVIEQQSNRVKIECAVGLVGDSTPDPRPSAVPKQGCKISSPRAMKR